MDSVTAMIVAGAWIAVFCPLATYVLAPATPGGRSSTDVRHTFSEESVTEVLSDSETRYDWQHWLDVSLVGDAYVLRSERGYNFIPRRAFAAPEDEQRFRHLVARVGETGG